MRAAPSDRLLSDGEWAQIASDVMDRTGLAPAGQEDDAVRWVAIRRGSDRIHIVATLARQDRGKPRLWNDWYRVRDACRAAEERYGLQRTGAHAGSHADRNPSTREIRRAQGITAAGEAPPHAATPRQHRRRSRHRGEVLRLPGARPGCASANDPAPNDPLQVIGYAVALPGDTAKDGSPVWYGGGKLGADLTLPRLRPRWAQPGIAALRASSRLRRGRNRGGFQLPFPAPSQSRRARPTWTARRAMASRRSGRSPLPGN